MEETLRLPHSTMHEVYQYDRDQLDTSLFDATFHLKKTEFSEYSEKLALETQRERARVGKTK